MKKNDSLPKSTSFIIKLLVLFIIMISSITVNSQNNECKATLIVKDNENSKKAGESGIFYELTLKNNGSQRTVFLVSMDDHLNSNSDVSKKYGNSNHPKVKLNGNFYSMNLEKLNEKSNSSNLNSKKDSERSDAIALNSGESYSFYVKLELPVGTEIGSVNSSTVNVTSKNCNNFIVSATLNTEIIDSE